MEFKYQRSERKWIRDEINMSAVSDDFAKLDLKVNKAHNILLTAQLKHLEKDQSNVGILRLYDGLVQANQGFDTLTARIISEGNGKAINDLASALVKIIEKATANEADTDEAAMTEMESMDEKLDDRQQVWESDWKATNEITSALVKMIMTAQPDATAHEVYAETSITEKGTMDEKSEAEKAKLKVTVNEFEDGDVDWEV